MPARDVVRDGHDDPRVCPCSYHRWLREAPADDGPDVDDLLDPCHEGPAARVCGCCADLERTSR